MNTYSFNILNMNILNFICNTTAPTTCVTVCALGGPETMSVCNSFVPGLSLAALEYNIGYGSYTCGTNMPPPPSPPPPPPFQDFPHSCFPGNSASNEGVGTGTGINGFAWNILPSFSGNNITFTVVPNPSCNPSYSGGSTCCSSNLNKIEFVINANCRGAIASVVGSLLPSYQFQTWPGTPPPGFTTGESLLIAKVTGMDLGGVQSQQVTITLRPDAVCSTPSKFLYNGEFWFAAYGTTTRLDGCCGTEIVGI
ncbi:hypothetical protein CEUSTIGMA_g8638.t1 [Chlamydomonas eustigma]|uniref:Pherophorin domain-containing protein n=1 Tax=Chlamydomonas eustigma TaxID=1157962 RepID=A0A250XDR6_9CHLO|nr:hypothetical protein CEUSTIGMA_g8638.t1 [Chlamydomonas eustigma]|eukprot:GAX81206.1 hypothetical protein CEUSTIGMA_g8638.t1 [Chlamydomonas eustigma]